MRGEWIEIESRLTMAGNARWSLPMRGEWIEIGLPQWTPWFRKCLSPCGESGLKLAPDS